MKFDTDFLIATNYLKDSEINHLIAVNKMLTNLEEMRKPNSIFDKFNVHNFTVDIKLHESNTPIDKKCYSESFAAFDNTNEYIKNNLVYEEFENFLQPINDLYYCFLGDTSYSATLPLYLSNDDYCQDDIVATLVNDELMSKIEAAKLSRSLSSDTKSEKSSKPKI